MSRPMTFSRLKGIYTDIKKSLDGKHKKVKDWNKIGKAIETYLKSIVINDGPETSLIGIDEDLLLTYSRSLIAIGKKAEALKIMNLIEKMFIGIENLPLKIRSEEDSSVLMDELNTIINSPSRRESEIKIYKYLVILYAMCSSEKDVERILSILKKTTKVDNELYMEIAYNCWMAGRLDYAKKLYEQVLKTTRDENERRIANASLERITKQQQHPTEFGKCWYSAFCNSIDSCGNSKTLEPGHVITARNIYRVEDGETLRTEFTPNTHFMIWKRDGKKLYVFQLTTNEKMTNYYHNYIIKAENYPLYMRNRALKDSLSIVYLTDVEKVEDRIKKEDYDKAIATMYDSICYSNGGQIKEEHREFIREITKRRQVFVGNIIITSVRSGPLEYLKKYFIVGIDRDKKVYRAIEVDSRANALSNEIVELDMKRTKIKSILPCGSQRKSEQLLKQAGILKEDGNMQGIIFDLNGQKLEIMQETKTSYICMDVTKSLWPDPIKIISVEKNKKLNILTRISDSQMFDRQSPQFSGELGKIQETIKGRTLTKTLGLKGNKFKVKR